MEGAAIVAAVLMAVIGAFQLALAAGAPWGVAAYGGTWPGVLPKGIRINSLGFGAVVYPLAILYILDAGGSAEFSWLPASQVVVWVLVAFFGLGAVVNAASRSKIERWWAPVALAITVCCVIVAIG
jgi:hypothetical protein